MNMYIPTLWPTVTADRVGPASLAARSGHGCRSAQLNSAPAKLRRNIAQDRIDDVGAVVDTELIGDGQQERVGGSDRLIPG